MTVHLSSLPLKSPTVKCEHLVNEQLPVTGFLEA